MLFFFVLLILAASSVLYMYYRYAADLPALAEMSDYQPPVITKVYDVKGRIIGEFCEERRKVIAPDEIPSILKQAVVAIEDRRFYKHKGVDYKGIVRAFYVNLKKFDFVQGGSTISMQVARTFFLSRERTFDRKIKEALLALRIERNFTKQEILGLYLNQIYLGHGVYGVEAAAEEYFGKKVDKLTIAECALLAGLPQKPAHLDPFRHPEAALERRKEVLDDMLDLGMISDEEHKQAIAEQLDLKRRKNPTRREAPYFTEYVRQYLLKQYGADTLYREGLEVFTTIDLEWTKAAQKALRKGLRRQDRLLGWRGPKRFEKRTERDEYYQKLVEKYESRPSKNDIVEAMITEVPGGSNTWAKLKIGKYSARLPEKYKKWIRKLNTQPHEKLKNVPKPTSNLKRGDFVKVKILDRDGDGTLVVGLEQEPILQGAIITIDPFTGEIKSMVGGSDFNESEYNRAVLAKRQPGSSFKPFIYAAAIDSGYMPATVIVDTPITLQGPSGPWKPKNYGGKFSGPRTFASALQHSVNTISVRILRDIGVGKVVKYARNMGITSDLNRDLTLALGTPSITLIELARAYGPFSTGGRLVPTVSVRRVYDRFGQILEDRVPHVEGYDKPPDDLYDFIEWSEKGAEPYWGMNGLGYRNAIAQARGKEVLSPQTAYVMVTLLRNVVEHGTGRYARIRGMEIAGKTGTTDKYRDALFVGFTTNFVTAVWVGHDAGRLLMGHGCSGGDVAAPIWQDAMYPAVKGKSIPQFPRPEGVVIYSFDLINGTFPCPDSKKIGQAAFLDGTQPTQCAPLPGDGMDLYDYDIKPPDEIPF